MASRGLVGKPLVQMFEDSKFDLSSDKALAEVLVGSLVRLGSLSNTWSLEMNERLLRSCQLNLSSVDHPKSSPAIREGRTSIVAPTVFSKQ